MTTRQVAAEGGLDVLVRGCLTSTGTPLVVVHGTATSAATILRRFSALANERLLIAPSFDVPSCRGYQRLAGSGGPFAAADALSATLGALGAQLPFPIGAVDLFGYSGGAQFVHRFAMLYPHRVRRMVVASAGWYTYLHEDRLFPSGIRIDPLDDNHRVSSRAFLEIPLRIMVGENDTSRDRLLRTGEQLDREQGSHRLARAVRWREHLDIEADGRGLPRPASLELLPGTTHSLRDAVERGNIAGRVAAFLDR